MIIILTCAKKQKKNNQQTNKQNKNDNRHIAQFSIQLSFVLNDKTIKRYLRSLINISLQNSYCYAIATSRFRTLFYFLNPSDWCMVYPLDWSYPSYRSSDSTKKRKGRQKTVKEEWSDIDIEMNELLRCTTGKTLLIAWLNHTLSCFDERVDIY